MYISLKVPRCLHGLLPRARLDRSLSLSHSFSAARFSVGAFSRYREPGVRQRAAVPILSISIIRIGSELVPDYRYRPVARLDASRRILMLRRSFLATRDAGIRIVERGATRARTRRGILRPRPLVSRKIRNFHQISRGRGRKKSGSGLVTLGALAAPALGRANDPERILLFFL